MHMNVLPACIYVHCVCTCCLRMSEEGVALLELELQIIVSYHVGAEIKSRFPED